MFKVGDRIICVDNNGGMFPLTINKEYQVLGSNLGENLIYIRTDKNGFDPFLTNRFLSVKEHRKLKLEKICSK